MPLYEDASDTNVSGGMASVPPKHPKSFIFKVTFLYMSIAFVYIALFSIKVASNTGVLGHAAHDWIAAGIYGFIGLIYVFLTISHINHKAKSSNEYTELSQKES